MPDIIAIEKKLKTANEKNHYLRKVIYELDRISYEKGTRKGDYLLREIIKTINDELELYDIKINACSLELKGSFLIIREALLFFEERYLNTFTLIDKIALLKEEFVNQQKADIEHNKTITDEKQKRYINNSYRAELEKDIRVFENAVKNKLVPHLTAFLLEINELYFIRSTLNLKKPPAAYMNQDSDKIINEYKENINLFVRIYLKLKKQYPVLENILEAVLTVLEKNSLKNNLLKFFSVDESGLSRMIQQNTGDLIFSAGFSNNGIQASSSSPEMTQKARLKSDIDKILNDLKYLRHFDMDVKGNANEYNNNVSENLKKYFYHSPDKSDISLKDVADYLMDSLVFLNEWLYVDIKKYPGMFSNLKLLLNCIPLENRFFELFRSANIESEKVINQKKNVWGELKQYIPLSIAQELKEVIRQLGDELDDAFKSTIVDIGLMKTPNSAVSGKKVNIVYESFYNSYRKILTEFSKL
ncbi:MAG: hypothetical protein JW864_17855 [Spirochaetes bacterium]|nr:hypothetical protein [Spirochaetota bacterium]